MKAVLVTQSRGPKECSDAKAPEAGSPKQPTSQVRRPRHQGHLRTDLIYRKEKTSKFQIRL